MPPLLWWGPGSDGTGPERFSIRTPVSVSPDRKVDVPEEGVEVEQDPYRIRILREDPGFRLAVEPFADAEEAEAAWDEVRSALLRAALVHKAGLRVPSSVERARELEEPQPIADSSPVAPLTRKRGWDATDGNYDALQATVVPEHKRLIRFGAGSGRAILHIRAENLAETVAEGLTSPHVARLAASPKQQLAIELYTSAFFEGSQRVKVVRLVTVLEVLAERLETHRIARKAWEAAVRRVERFQAEYDPGSPERQHVQRLLERMTSLGMNEESIRRSIRLLVERATTVDAELGDAADLKRRVMDAYDVRSKLVHDGEAPAEAVGDASRFLHDFTPGLLLSAIEHGTIAVQSARGEG